MSANNTAEGQGSAEGNPSYQNDPAMSDEPLIPQNSPTSSSHSHRPEAPLKAWSLAVILFYAVSGGPFGIEPTIRAGGNLAAILGFMIAPFIFSVPEALVTAELGSAFQCASGGVAWVEEAFGESTGFLCGWLSWISGATDNAIYPILFLEYLESVLGYKDNDEEMLSGIQRFGSVVGIAVVLSLLNYRGLDIAAKTALVICIVAMSPFVPMIIAAIPKIVPSRWLQKPEQGENTEELFDDDLELSPGPLRQTGLYTMAGILWRPYVSSGIDTILRIRLEMKQMSNLLLLQLNNLFWCLNSFDSAACFATETDGHKSAYTRGILYGFIMMFISYVIPILIVTGATDYAQSEWVDGHIGAAAIDIGGNWLGAWVLLGAGVSSLGQFEAEMSSDSFMLLGMSERGYLPKVYKQRSKYGTPTVGIITGTIVIISMGWAEFSQLVEILNANYALSLLLEYCAFVKLRHTRSESKFV